MPFEGRFPCGLGQTAEGRGEPGGRHVLAQQARRLASFDERDGPVEDDIGPDAGPGHTQDVRFDVDEVPQLGERDVVVHQRGQYLLHGGSAGLGAGEGSHAGKSTRVRVAGEGPQRPQLSGTGTSARARSGPDVRLGSATERRRRTHSSQRRQRSRLLRRRCRCPVRRRGCRRRDLRRSRRHQRRRGAGPCLLPSRRSHPRQS